MADTREKKRNLGHHQKDRPKESTDLQIKHDREATKRKSNELTDAPAKMSFSLNNPHSKSSMSAMVKKPVKISLGNPQPNSTKPVLQSSKLQKKSETVAAAFNQDDDSEEEMPIEAKMRMRNLGKDTPVPAGPNSFGKGKLGFSHDYRMYEKKLLDNLDVDGKK